MERDIERIIGNTERESHQIISLGNPLGKVIFPWVRVLFLGIGGILRPMNVSIMLIVVHQP